MGQEIAYCALCGCRLRSADFEKGGAFRIDLQSYCKKCAPEAVKSLPPEKIQALLKQGGTPKEPSTGCFQRIPKETDGRAPTGRLLRPSPRKRSPQQNAIVAGAGIALAATALLLFLFLPSRPTPEAPQTRSLAPQAPAEPGKAAIKPPVPNPAPLAKTPEELLSEEAQRKLDEIKALESKIGAEDLRRKYAEFARAYPGTPQGKTIERWLKGSETAPMEPAPATPVVEAPKTPLPDPPAPAEPVPAAPASKRPAVPAAVRLREAEAAYQKTFRPDQAKSPAEKAKLARTLLGAAVSSGAKDADLYVLLKEARELAAAGLDPATALEAIEARVAAFDVDPIADAVDLFAKSTVKGPAAAVWAGLCLETADRMADGDEFEAALKLAARAEALARAANDKGIEAAAKDRGRELADLKRAADGIRMAFKTLETKPDDPAANAAVGKFVCLVKGDWKRGLPMLAKGSDPVLKSISDQELSKPTEAAAEGALGEAWASFAEKETPTYKARARARAAEWLGRAIPRLTGLAKVSAEKTLAGLPMTAAKDRLALDLGAGLKLELVAIKPGTFTMGGTMAPALEWQQDERPEHRVTLTRGYLLGKYEVTRGQFAQFVKVTGYKTDAERDGKTFGRPPSGGWVEIAGMSWLHMTFPQTDEHPVVCISWNDARAFCDWAAKKTGRGVRLPTEAEWEYACRAGTRTKFASGDDESAMMDWAWIATNSAEQTRAAGQRKPNAWGLFDMHGNAWEWCQDWAGPYTGDAVDPPGPAGGDRHILRGGGCSNPAIDCRSSFRLRFYPVDRAAAFGFRVVVS